MYLANLDTSPLRKWLDSSKRVNCTQQGPGPPSNVACFWQKPFQSLFGGSKKTTPLPKTGAKESVVIWSRLAAVSGQTRTQAGDTP
ncbi:hypothetical protein N7492_000395 [Penicillium capsulatum]|uniref:Uncharacterized protein n=1 Tax=Penicillium capsulatum TaxID=69766 RepID=A0A9W9IRP6_9EURO|nr:hypothetical protein N7492_000395 [Penicillium capsulatum]